MQVNIKKDGKKNTYNLINSWDDVTLEKWAKLIDINNKARFPSLFIQSLLILEFSCEQTVATDIKDARSIESLNICVFLKLLFQKFSSALFRTQMYN